MNLKMISVNSHLFFSSYLSSPGNISKSTTDDSNDISYFDLEDGESQILFSRGTSFVCTPTPQLKRKPTFLNNLGCSGDPGMFRFGSVESGLPSFGSGF